MKRGIVAALAATLIVGVGAAGSASASGGPVAQASKACSIAGKERKLGASYVTSLKVTGVSCRKGKKVTKGYHACRKANGGAGSKSCPTPVRGFNCKTKVLQEVKGVQFNAKMICKKGEKRVVSKYTQNT